MKKVLFLIVLAGLLMGCSGTLTVDNTPVDSIDLNRYLGSWYEIARFDHRFERGMEQTKAQYTMREDGMIDVLNTGIKDGEPKEAKGKAKLTDIPAYLRVSFFGPFYGDYRVMLLDSAYQYSLVGSGSDDYLWILSRTPRISDDVKTTILNEAKRRGYDINKLIWVKQEAVDSVGVVAQDSAAVSAEADGALEIPIQDFRAFLDNIDVQHAEKCGLTYLYDYEDDGGEEGDAGSHDVVYGLNVEKGEKTDYGYQLKPTSRHACYFQYSEDTSTHASLNFTDKADADRFFEAFLKSGVVDCGGMYVVVKQEIPAGEVITVDTMRDYDGKYSIEKPVLNSDEGFYTIIICWFA